VVIYFFLFCLFFIVLEPVTRVKLALGRGSPHPL